MSYEPYVAPVIASRGWRVGPTEHPMGLAVAEGDGLEAAFSVDVTVDMELAVSAGDGVEGELLYTGIYTFDMLPAESSGDGVSAVNTSALSVTANLADGSGGDALTPTLSITYPYVWTDDFNRSNSSTSLGTGWTNRNNAMGINSNAAYAVGNPAQASNDTTMPSNDQQLDIVLGSVQTSDRYVQIGIGYNTSGNGVWAYIVNGQQALICIQDDWATPYGNGGTPVAISTSNITTTAGDTFSLKRVSNVYTVLKNGSAITGASWTDSGNLVTRDSNHRLTSIGGSDGGTGWYRRIDSATATTP